MAATLRLPNDVEVALAAYCDRTGATKNGTVVAALRRFLDLATTDTIEAQSTPGLPERSEPLTTRTGRVLTDQDVQELADEAERGYDPETIVPRQQPTTLSPLAKAAREVEALRRSAFTDPHFKPDPKK